MSSEIELCSPESALYQPDKCIICQKKIKKCSVTSTPNGRTKITEAAIVRKDAVLERLEYVEKDFVYHMDNECYKSYVMKKTVDKLKEAELEIKENDNENNHDLEPQSKRTR